MTDKDILISDLNDISEILNNNGYGRWCEAIQKAVFLLKEQENCENCAIAIEDRQPIVRCKDCQWFHQAFKNEGRCIKHDNDFHDTDWFCADGVKKDA